MNLTRRDALKTIASITAIAVAPATGATSSLVPKEDLSTSEATPETEEMLKQIDILLFLISSKRGFAYDEEKDFIEIYLPHYCNEKEISSRFINSHPTAQYYGRFHVFANCNRLLVRLNRFINPEDDGMDKIFATKDTWAYADFEDKVLLDYRLSECPHFFKGPVCEVA